MKSKKILGPVLLLSAAMIWGLSFVFQKEGMDYVDTFTFNGIRTMVGAVVLLPIAIFRKRKAELAAPKTKEQKKKELRGILIVGMCLFVGSNLQQAAFKDLAPGKVGFITALYMLLVPVFGFLIFRRRLAPTVWIGVGIGLVGLYLLCVGTGVDLSFGKGEILTLICAFAFAFHIIAIDYFASDVDSVVLSCGQFLIAGGLSCVCMFIFEKPEWSNIIQAGIPILYAGIMSCGVAFTFQIIGQKYTEPTLASMLLCLESVFSVIFSLIILHTQMLPREYIGCAVMFGAILLAQIPSKSEKQNQ